MARRLAVVVIQPPGLGGTPSAGHRSTATANASAAISSAMSRSPKRLVSAATTRAHSSRWTRVIASATERHSACEGTHLDLAPAGLRPLGGQLQRHVEVGSLDDPEAAEVLLRLQVGTVGDHRLGTLPVDDGRGRGRRQAVGEDPVALVLQSLVERAGVGHACFIASSEG